MSFPKELDEYTEHELLTEIMRRRTLRARGLCDYCGREKDSVTCRFDSRHGADPERCPLCGCDAMTPCGEAGCGHCGNGQTGLCKPPGGTTAWAIPINAFHATCPTCHERLDVIPPEGTVLV